MYTSTLTSKGTVTIPANYRKLINIKPSDKINFVVHEGKILLSKKPDIKEAFGALYNPKVKPLSAEEINKSIAKGLFANKK